MHVFSECSTSNVIHRRSVCMSGWRCWNRKKNLSPAHSASKGDELSLHKASSFTVVSWFSCHHWFCRCTLTVRKQWNGSQLLGLSSNLSTLFGESTQSSILFLSHYFSGSYCKMASIVRQIISFFDICATVIVLYCFFLLFSGLAVKYFTCWICFLFFFSRETLALLQQALR